MIESTNMFKSKLAAEAWLSISKSVWNDVKQRFVMNNGKREQRFVLVFNPNK